MTIKIIRVQENRNISVLCLVLIPQLHIASPSSHALSHFPHSLFFLWLTCLSPFHDALFVDSHSGFFFKISEVSLCCASVLKVCLGCQILQTSWGLELYWDGQEELDIVLSTAFMNTLCGLCGNFNFKPEDDWTVGPGCKELEGSVVSIHGCKIAIS